MNSRRIAEYKEWAVGHGEETRSGNSKGANRAYDKLAEKLGQISAASQDAELFPLYEDEDLWVQSWAATHTLEIDEQRAVGKLRELVESGDAHLRTDAFYILQEWSAGRLRFRKD